MELSSSSQSAALLWVVATVIVAVIPIWALKMLNSRWLRPRRIEKLLRAQGLRGDPYSLSPPSNQNRSPQNNPDPQSFAVSDDVAPQISTPIYSVIAKYGKNSFLWEGRTPKVIISDPNQIKEVFNNDIHDFHKPELSDVAKFLMNGLISYEGEKWAKHRRIMNPAFHLEKLKNMMPAFSQSCYDMISTWKGMLSSDGKCELDVLPFLQNLTCEVISRTAFGSSYAEGEKIFRLLKMQGYVLFTAKANAMPILRLLPTTTQKKMRAIDRDIHDSIQAIIEKRLKAMKNGETCNKDLLSILLESNQMEIQGHGNSKSAGMTNQEVIAECKLFYLAGQETTSSLLVWTMILLSRFPEWQERAREEVLHVFGKQDPNFQGLSDLKTMTMILYEVLRLYGPAVYFNRTLEKDMKLGNLSLPAGVNVSLPIFLIHQDADMWGDDVKEFKPERFSEGIAKATKGEFSYFPFGWGPRMCIGQNFALLEAKIVLSLLLQNFSFQLSPSYKHAPTAVISLLPKHGAHIVLHKL